MEGTNRSDLLDSIGVDMEKNPDGDPCDVPNAQPCDSSFWRETTADSVKPHELLKQALKIAASIGRGLLAPRP